MEFGHLAKRKPQHPVSLQQRIKTGLLGAETVEKIASVATGVVNHEEIMEPVRKAKIFKKCLFFVLLLFFYLLTYRSFSFFLSVHANPRCK